MASEDDGDDQTSTEETNAERRKHKKKGNIGEMTMGGKKGKLDPNAKKWPVRTR